MKKSPSSSVSKNFFVSFLALSLLVLALLFTLSVYRKGDFDIRSSAKQQANVNEGYVWAISFIPTEDGSWLAPRMNEKFYVGNLLAVQGWDLEAGTYIASVEKNVNNQWVVLDEPEGCEPHTLIYPDSFVRTYSLPRVTTFCVIPEEWMGYKFRINIGPKSTQSFIVVERK